MSYTWRHLCNGKPLQIKDIDVDEWFLCGRCSRSDKFKIFPICISTVHLRESTSSLAISVTCMEKKRPIIFKTTNSENRLWLIYGEEPMAAGKTVYNINCKKKKKTKKETKRSKRAKNRNWTEPRPKHHACKYTERNWDHCFAIYTPRPLATKVQCDDSKFYNFLISYTITNTTICWALSIISYWPDWPCYLTLYLSLILIISVQK